MAARCAPTGSLTLAQLGHVTGSGHRCAVRHGARLELGGATLDVKPGTAPGDLLVTGTLKNGTVFEDSGTLTVQNGTLDGITVLGALSLNGQTVWVKDGLTVKTMAGGAPGTIDLSANGSEMVLLDSETLDNVVLTGSQAGTTSYIYFNQSTSDLLTLGAHASFTQSGGNTQFYGTSAGQGVVNLGTMALSGGTFNEYALTFSNQGTITLGAGETFTDQGYTLDNQGLIEALANSGTVTFNINNGAFLPLINGTTLAAASALKVDDGTTLDMALGGASDGTIAVDGASITLERPGLRSEFLQLHGQHIHPAGSLAHRAHHHRHIGAAGRTLLDGNERAERFRVVAARRRRVLGTLAGGGPSPAVSPASARSPTPSPMPARSRQRVAC